MAFSDRLSHVCWLLAYPLAGWVGAAFGLGVALASLSVLALLGLSAALRLWPRHEQAELAHRHDGLPPDHPHLAEHTDADGIHRHRYRIDTLHRRWPG